MARKHFGRNQKRKMREEIERLTEEVKNLRGLNDDINKKYIVKSARLNILVGMIQSITDRLAAEESNRSILLEPKEIRVNSVTSRSMKYHIIRNKCLEISDRDIYNLESPYNEDSAYITLNKVWLAIERRKERLQALIHFFINDQEKMAYVISTEGLEYATDEFIENVLCKMLSRNFSRFLTELKKEKGL